MSRVVAFIIIFAGCSLATDGLPPAPRSHRPLAMLCSAALPGTGQMLMGSQKRGEALLWLDGTIWATWAGLRWYGGTRENDARLVAAREAGADLGQREPRYYKALEAYDNADQYNEQVRSDARSRFPDNPEAQHAYYDSLGYFGREAWNWSSDSARIGFWQIRRSGRSAMQVAGFAVAGLVLNRLASVIDCAFFAREPGLAGRVQLMPSEGRPGIGVCYRF